jgi:hypothetical protein
MDGRLPRSFVFAMLLVGLVVVAPVAHAQMSVEEAQARLAQRIAQRDSQATTAPAMTPAAATQPATPASTDDGEEHGHAIVAVVIGVVVFAAFVTLASIVISKVSPAEPENPAPDDLVTHPRYSGPFIICPNPNCGYRGPACKQAKGSVVVLIILLLMWLLPGILYAIFCCIGSRLLCPQCGVHVRDE